MPNYAMIDKIKKGTCVDLSKYQMEGEHYIMPAFIEDVDFCNAVTNRWIWSVGKRHSDGVILASHKDEFYQNADYDCLWLR